MYPISQESKVRQRKRRIEGQSSVAGRKEVAITSTPRRRTLGNCSGSSNRLWASKQRSLRQLRLGGMAAVLESRLRQAQAEPMAPIDLMSCLVSDELHRRSERLLDRLRKQAAFRDPAQDHGQLRFQFQPENESQPGLRSGHLRLHRQSGRRLVSRAQRSRDILHLLATSLKSLSVRRRILGRRANAHPSSQIPANIGNSVPSRLSFPRQPRLTAATSHSTCSDWMASAGISQGANGTTCDAVIIFELIRRRIIL